MGASAGFYGNQTMWLASKEFQDLPTPQLLAKHNSP
jgi:hypothetical protein